MIGSLDTYFGILKCTKDHKATALFNYVLSRCEADAEDWGYCILYEKDIIEITCLKSDEIAKLLNKLKRKYQLLDYNYQLYLRASDKIEFRINKSVYNNVITGVI